MKTLKEYYDNFRSKFLTGVRWSITVENAYKQGFVDATKLAAENAHVVEFHFSYEQDGKRIETNFGKRIYASNDHVETDKQSILKAIEDE